MPSDTSIVAPTPPALRSAVSNGTRLLHGVDGRSVPARRYRDLIVAYAEPLGGLANLPDADKAMVRHAAALTIRSEQLHASILLGHHVDDEELTRLTNSLSRMVAGLRERATPAPGTLGLSDYLKNRGAAA
jgi:hypothetical protein